MSPSPSTLPTPANENRTNVRNVQAAPDSPGQRLRRLGMFLFGTLTPALSERWALARFATPERPRPPRPPSPPGMQGRAFTVDGHAGRDGPAGQLAAWEWGAGPTVLLVHGWSGHAGQMSGFVPALVAAGHRVVAFDQPAHGLSGGHRTSMLEFRDALLALARRLGPIHGVIAHSLGGTATLLALDRGLPAGRTVLLAPPIDPFPFARAFAAQVGLPAARAEGLVQRLREFLRADLGDRYAVDMAAQAKVPLLVIHDRDDRAVPLAHGQALAGAAPDAGLLTVSGLGHRRLLADPQVIDSAVAFLRTGARPAATQPAIPPLVAEQRSRARA